MSEHNQALIPGFEIEGTKLLKYTGNESDVIIPEGITHIGGGAFEQSHIKTIVFPDSLHRISDFAFSDCSSLESLMLNEGLTIIDHNAFYNCGNLKKISLPKSLFVLGEEVFSRCNRIGSIDCNGNETFSFVDGCLIYEGTTIIRIFGDTIPENPEITTIHSYAFDNENISHIFIPKNIKHIRYNAFISPNPISLEIQNPKDIDIEDDAVRTLPDLWD